MTLLSRPILTLLAILLFASSVVAQEAEAPAAPACGTQPITIARMQWPSAAILAEIHARLLAAHFGCEVSVVPGDLAATASSMSATGQPAVAPEMWLARVPEIWNPAVKAQQVRQAGVTFVEPALEGWFIPDYVAATNPDLVSAEALKTQWQVLAGTRPKPRFISCPIDWGCSIINRNLLRALGLDAVFEIVEPANRFELDTLIAEAVSRQEPVLFYYWQPNAVLSQFAFKQIDLGPSSAEAFACLGRRVCAAPVASAFAPEPVVIAVAEWVFVEVTDVASYFQRAKMPVAEMNALLAALTVQGATIESVADGFVAGRQEVWGAWVGMRPPQ